MYIGWDFKIDDLAYAAARGDVDAIHAVLAKEGRRPFESGLPLVLASGDRRAGVAILQNLVSLGGDVNKHAGDIATYPLGAAVRTGALDKVEFLIEQGARSDYSNSGFGVWLDIAYCYEESQAHLVEYFLDRNADYDSCSAHGEQALQVLCRRGKFELMKRLIDNGADKKPLGWNDVMWSIVYGTNEELEALLKVDDGEIYHLDGWSRSPWLLAAQVGDVGKSKLLLKYGSNWEDRDRVGESALHYALRSDSHEMLMWLLSIGFGTLGVEKGEKCPLIYAAEQGAVGCMEVLLEAGSPPMSGIDFSQLDIVDVTSIEAVRLLVSRGADIDYESAGYWLLNSAVESEDIERLRRLLELGADPNRTSTGDTALHKAFAFDYLDMAALLLEYGANINAEDVDGYSVLHECKTQEAVELALSAGVDVSIRDIMGQTAAESLQGSAGDYLRSRTGS